MNINATLLGEMISFGLLVWFTMKFIWPPITQAMNDRQKKIAEGLASADRGRHELELAQQRASEILREAREQAAKIVDQANKRGGEIIDESKDAARQEGERLLAASRAQMEQEVQHAKAELRGQVVALAISGATKILGREVDQKAHNDMLQDLAKQL